MNKPLMFILAIIFVLIVGAVIFRYQFRSPLDESVSIPQGEVPREASQREKEMLATGEKMSVGAFTVEFVSVIEDSRCPEGVDCVQPGDVTIKILVEEPSLKKEYTLSPLRRFPLSVGEHYLRLERVDPMRKPNEKIKSKDYRASFVMTSKNSVSKEIAKEKAKTLLGKRFSQEEATLLDEPQEYGFGWVFPYRVDTTTPRATNSVAGPLVVFRDGTVLFLTSSMTPEAALQETQASWQASQME